MLPSALLARLACPVSKQPLLYFPRGADGHSEDDAFLLCPTSRLRYRIDDDVPVLLVEEAVEVSEGEVRYLLERAAALGAESRSQPS